MKIARLNSGPELFYSLQGEGASVGEPALFLRLAGCNLACCWCDTKYSWGRGVDLSVADVAHLILSQPQCPRLIITGGEPLMQQQQLAELLALLPAQLPVEFETNGTLAPCEALLARVTQWNVSPKLAHAGQVGSLREDVLAVFAALPHAWFKFVVEAESDVAELLALDLPQHRIILMPRSESREELREARARLAPICVKYALRLGDRLHLELWDKKKGI